MGGQEKIEKSAEYTEKRSQIYKIHRRKDRKLSNVIDKKYCNRFTLKNDNHLPLEAQ